MTGLPQTAPLGALGVSVSSGTVAARDKHGAFTLFGSTGPIGRTADGKYRGEAVLVARVGANAGHVYRVHGQYGVTDNTLIVSPGNGLSARYLEQFLLHQDLNRLVYGSGQPLITGRTLKELDVPVLNELEREMVATALGDVDEFIETTESLIAKKRAVKQGMMQALLTGRTRLPGFEGEWRLTTLGEISRVVGGGTPSKGVESYWGGPIPWITIKDISSFNPRGAQEYITASAVKASATRIVPAGTPVLATRMLVGKAVRFQVDVAINQDIKALLTGGDADDSYLCHWFDINGLILAASAGGSTVAGTSTAQIKSLEIGLPPIAEQRAIASVLDDADAEIAALERRLESARAIKQGMMQELLTGRTRLPVKEDGE